MTKQLNPGVRIPPPLIYVAIFLLSLLINRYWPLPGQWLKNSVCYAAGWICIGAGLTITIPALARFIRSKNTLMTIRPATSLQTAGIYSYTRNPMYLGLVFLYTGIAFFKGNMWTFILLPVVITIIQQYVIKREEKYLTIAFPAVYPDYCKKVRRWV
ncbi:MAG: isoprenylcysteine carboxylmethyltransferase family protein [Bacteroidetes bacterium]|nr:isoprenylcysteine carboxylmethyltransferase family protein [Bacteroidota bacterium]